MIRIAFKDKEIAKLRHERFHHPSIKVQQKMEALYLKSMGVRHHEICRLCNISKTTLISYLREYQEGGIDQLKTGTKYKGLPEGEKSIRTKPGTKPTRPDHIIREESWHKHSAHWHD